MIRENQTAVNLTIQHYGELAQFIRLISANNWPNYEPSSQANLIIEEGQGNEEIVAIYRANEIFVANKQAFEPTEIINGIGYWNIGNDFIVS